MSARILPVPSGLPRRSVLGIPRRMVRYHRLRRLLYQVRHRAPNYGHGHAALVSDDAAQQYVHPIPRPRR